MIKLNLDYAKYKMRACDVSRGQDAYKKLLEASSMTDWMHKSISADELKAIKLTAKKVRKDCDVFIVCGIGGSFMGAKAVIDALSPYYKKKNDIEILFVGRDLSGQYLKETMEYIKGKSVYVNIISKSGGTLETTLATNILLKFMQKSFKDWKDRVIVTTGMRGALNDLSKENYLTTFRVPENIGGRYSVFSAVGLLPIAVMGFDVDKLLAGAKLKKETITDAITYGIMRNVLCARGYQVEAITAYERKYINLLNWAQQLFGESQGKGKKGVLPFANIFTTNLHSIGQYFQEGADIVFVTNIVERTRKNYIKQMDDVNALAVDCVSKAFAKGNTPSITISVDKMDETALGELMQFMMYASAVGGFALDVNPFDQNGVEEYKKNIKNAMHTNE